jgi:hypothetical protein
MASTLDERLLTDAFRSSSAVHRHAASSIAGSVPTIEEHPMKTYAALAATFLLATSAAANAHDYSYGTREIDVRRASEARRINNGLRTGQLTWREYRYLRYEQGRIAADERRAKADGHVSRSERYRLNRELDQASRHISRLKHNDRVAWWKRW